MKDLTKLEREYIDNLLADTAQVLKDADYYAKDEPAFREGEASRSAELKLIRTIRNKLK